MLAPFCWGLCGLALELLTHVLDYCALSDIQRLCTVCQCSQWSRLKEYETKRKSGTWTDNDLKGSLEGPRTRQTVFQRHGAGSPQECKRRVERLLNQDSPHDVIYTCYNVLPSEEELRLIRERSYTLSTGFDLDFSLPQEVAQTMRLPGLVSLEIVGKLFKQTRTSSGTVAAAERSLQAAPKLKSLALVIHDCTERGAKSWCLDHFLPPLDAPTMLDATPIGRLNSLAFERERLSWIDIQELRSKINFESLQCLSVKAAVLTWVSTSEQKPLGIERLELAVVEFKHMTELSAKEFPKLRSLILVHEPLSTLRRMAITADLRNQLSSLSLPNHPLTLDEAGELQQLQKLSKLDVWVCRSAESATSDIMIEQLRSLRILSELTMTFQPDKDATAIEQCKLAAVDQVATDELARDFSGLLCLKLRFRWASIPAGNSCALKLAEYFNRDYDYVSDAEGTMYLESQRRHSNNESWIPDFDSFIGASLTQSKNWTKNWSSKTLTKYNIGTQNSKERSEQRLRLEDSCCETPTQLRYTISLSTP